MWDFETGQKINELVTDSYGACHYDDKSGLCFISDDTLVSAIDLRMSEEIMVWDSLKKNQGPVSSLKYYDDKLYCGTSRGKLTAASIMLMKFLYF